MRVEPSQQGASRGVGGVGVGGQACVCSNSKHNLFPDPTFDFSNCVERAIHLVWPHASLSAVAIELSKSCVINPRPDLTTTRLQAPPPGADRTPCLSSTSHTSVPICKTHHSPDSASHQFPSQSCIYPYLCSYKSKASSQMSLSVDHHRQPSYCHPHKSRNPLWPRSNQQSSKKSPSRTAHRGGYGWA